MPVPVFSEPSDEEKVIARLQLAYTSRMRKSQYFIAERTKSTGHLFFLSDIRCIHIALKYRT